MRLTGGLDRGRRLHAPRGVLTRPTSAKVREAIFNILGPPPQGAVLDLYAGSGALGIEALSRGAGRAVFVERDVRALLALRRNLDELGVASRATIVPVEVRTALRLLAAREDRFDWVFLDPPYASGEVSAILAELSGHALLATGAVVLVEHDKRHRPPDSVGGLFLTDQRSYGDTELSFFRAGQS